MAKVLSESGRYLTDKSFSNFRNLIVTAYAAGCITSLLLGFYFGYEKWGPKPAFWLSTLVSLLVLAAIALISVVVDRKLDEYDRLRRSYAKGATGEALVCQTIALLSDEYMVINDLQTICGNLDHVVIGPKGVFVIETKNWKGLVEPDGKGDVLINGQSPKKSMVNPIVAKTMKIRERIAAVREIQDISAFHYFKAVIVFPSAYVQPCWNKTGNADCVTLEMLLEYIESRPASKAIPTAEVEKLAEAFQLLHTMGRSQND